MCGFQPSTGTEDPEDSISVDRDSDSQEKRKRASLNCPDVQKWQYRKGLAGAF